MEKETEFSLKDSVSTLVSSAKKQEDLVFKKAPATEIQTAYSNIKHFIQSLTPKQQAQVMNSIRDSAIRVNGQQPDPGLNGYGTLRTVYSDVLTERLDDMYVTSIYAARNGNHEKNDDLTHQINDTIQGLPEDQLADLNSNIKTFHEAKDLSHLATLPQNAHLEAFERIEGLVSSEVTQRAQQTPTAPQTESLPFEQ